MRLAGLFLLVLARAACGTTPAPGGTTAQQGTTAPVSDVQWTDYAPGLQARIDALATAKDCTALQDEFDVADVNNDATLARTGHNNAHLMGYIDDKLRAAGCY
jgi:hypothetical protein